MGRKGTIEQLPPAIRQECDRLIRDGGVTIDAIVAALRELGATVPRATVGNYKKRMDERLSRYKAAQEVAGVWVRGIGEQPDSQMGQLLAELLKTLAFQTLSEAGVEGGEPASPMDLMLLGKSLDHIAGAEKKILDVRRALHAEWKAAAQARAEVAAAEVKEVARQAGLTDAAAAKIRELVLGVVG
ncbi:MAG TPA: phage protein Gp27 family protein [Longimicrobium sp.]|jgi:hypothetical protein